MYDIIKNTPKKILRYRTKYDINICVIYDKLIRSRI